jgi:hypothetical protein
LLNPVLWQTPAKQLAELGMNALNRLLEPPSREARPK